MRAQPLISAVTQIVSTLTQPRELEIRTDALEGEISKLTQQVRLQNNFWQRLLLGLATGVGTVLGATVVTTVVFFLLRLIFKVVGIDIDLSPAS